MGIFSIVIGILCVILIWLNPVYANYIIIPAVVGLIVGIVDMTLAIKKAKSRIISMTGILSCVIAIGFFIAWGEQIASTQRNNIDDYTKSFVPVLDSDFTIIISNFPEPPKQEPQKPPVKKKPAKKQR